jgi:hypothetical protein
MSDFRPYYELHLIVSGAEMEHLQPAAVGAGAWCSRLGEDQSNEEKPGDLIVTSRASTQIGAGEKLFFIEIQLRRQGFKVTRRKIEYVILDIRGERP